MARAHIAGDTRIDAARLAVLAGVAVRDGEAIASAYVGREFALAVVTTDYAVAVDRPLAASTLKSARGLGYWWGVNGAVSGRERNRRAKRPSHESRYPMEQVKRVERPTTLIIDDEVPQVPKRAAFFQRALHGDLGDKSKRERTRFAFKHPFSWSQLQLIRHMVPYQDGPVADRQGDGWADAAANARTIKALSYYLGADLTGICEVTRYA